MEEQLAKLKEIHTKRTQQREQIVADRVQQLLREVEGLGWGSDSGDGTGLLRYPARLPMFNSTLNALELGPASAPAPPVLPAIVMPTTK